MQDSHQNFSYLVFHLIHCQLLVYSFNNFWSWLMFNILRQFLRWHLLSRSQAATWSYMACKIMTYELIQINELLPKTLQVFTNINILRQHVLCTSFETRKWFINWLMKIMFGGRNFTSILHHLFLNFLMGCVHFVYFLGDIYSYRHLMFSYLIGLMLLFSSFYLGPILRVPRH